MNSRRALIIAIGASAFAVPQISVAQQQAKVAQIGFLARTSAASLTPLLEAFRQGLRDLGWVEGKTLSIEYRYAEGQLDRLPALAADLVRLKVDVIVMGDVGSKTLSHFGTQM